MPALENLVRITRIPREMFYQNLLELSDATKKDVQPPQLPLHMLSKFLSERVATLHDAPVPECTTCGACCALLLYVPVTMDDSLLLKEFVDVTLGDDDDAITIDRVLPRNIDNGYCTHLAGRLGDEIGCTIYRERPKVCRDFEAGSDRCHEYRRVYGFEQQLNDLEIAVALNGLFGVERQERISEARIVEADESGRLKIVVYIDNEAPHEIHEFDAAEEKWFEGEFLSLTMPESKELIAARSNQG
ncbi:MAG: YkgJ family cysteine cluster protein [Pyrinomonadaceae bacterium]